MNINSNELLQPQLTAAGEQKKKILLHATKAGMFWNTGFKFLVGNIAAQRFLTSPLSKQPERTDHYAIL